MSWTRRFSGICPCSFRGIACLLAFAATTTDAAAQSTQPATPAPWWERISFNGDFRGRYEGFFQDDRAARNRERFRLRVGLNARVNDEVAFGLRLGSGDPGDSTSTNQSMTEFFTRKPLFIDRAFITYKPAALKALTLGGGKYGYPVTRTQQVWDDDLNWEGTYQQFVGTTTGKTGWKLTFVQSPINEVSGGDDSFLFAEQAEVERAAGKHHVAFALSGYQFRQVDQVAIGIDTRVLRTQNTNRVTRNAAGAVTGFVSGFNLIDVIARASFDTGRARYPAGVLIDWVTNVDADSEGTGVWVVFDYGNASAPKTYGLSYTFARISRESVLSSFSFSDIPGTNLWMNMFGLSYMPLSRLNLDFTGIFTTRINPEPGDLNRLLSRIQVDARVTF